MNYFVLTSPSQFYSSASTNSAVSASDEETATCAVNICVTWLECLGDAIKTFPACYSQNNKITNK